MLTATTATLEQCAAQRLSGFAAFLHANGFAVGGGDAVQVLQVAERVGVLDVRVLRLSLQALLCGRRDEWRRFDRLFDAWFLRANRWQGLERGARPDRGPTGVQPGSATRTEPRADPETLQSRRAASPHEAHGSADFRALTQHDHVIEVEQLMRRFARRLKRIPLRREARARHGGRLDLAGTIRRSVSSGGMPVQLRWRNRRRVRPRLVLLIDVSRSMMPYSFFFLRMARALSAELMDLRSFIFHTRITAVSAALHDPDPWRAQEQLQLLARGWGGGTRIGESLAQFNREHAPRSVHSRTAVLIVSDGYDTGEPQMLSAALAQLRRRARRMVWINPLCGRADYAPISQGMQAALPHIDLLSPGGDLASLRAVLPGILEALR